MRWSVDVSEWTKSWFFEVLEERRRKSVGEGKWENEQSKSSICKLLDDVKLRCYFSEIIQVVHLRGKKEEKCLRASRPLKMEKPLLPNVRWRKHWEVGELMLYTVIYVLMGLGLGRGPIARWTPLGRRRQHYQRLWSRVTSSSTFFGAVSHQSRQSPIYFGARATSHTHNGRL